MILGQLGEDLGGDPHGALVLAQVDQARGLEESSVDVLGLSGEDLIAELEGPAVLPLGVGLRGAREELGEGSPLRRGARSARRGPRSARSRARDRAGRRAACSPGEAGPQREERDAAAVRLREAEALLLDGKMTTEEVEVAKAAAAEAAVATVTAEAE